MTPDTILLRQVHPHFVRDGRVLSPAFRPFPRDAGQLSVYDGSLIEPAESWRHWTATGHQSSGVWGVTVAETASLNLPARSAPLDGSPAHAAIDFSGHDRKQQDARAKRLTALAESRGCLFRARDGVAQFMPFSAA